MCWLVAAEERVLVEPNAKLAVLDRAFLHGDVIARASQALGLQGVVIGVRLECDVRFADGEIVRGVPSERLAQVRTHRPGHYCAHEDWVGRMEDVSDDVTVRFEDGSECVVVDASPDELIPSEHSSLFPDEEQCPYFPGLVVHASSAVLRRARWVRGRHKGGRSAGVVARVDAGDVAVRWLMGHEERAPPAPRGARDSKFPKVRGAPFADGFPASCLTPLEYFADTCWQLGDRAIVLDDPPERLHDDRSHVDAVMRRRPAWRECGAAARRAESAGPAGAVNRGTRKAIERGTLPESREHPDDSDETSGADGRRKKPKKTTHRKGRRGKKSGGGSRVIRGRRRRRRRRNRPPLPPPPPGTGGLSRPGTLARRPRSRTCAPRGR